MSGRPAFKVVGSGQPLVFQHGLTASAEQITGLLGGLPGICLISMDCPGHGQSPCPNDYIPSFDQYADSLVQLMEEQLISRAIVGGLSMGAGISLNIALRYPEKVTALILLRPAWLDQEFPENLRIIERGARYIKKYSGHETFQKEIEFQKIKSSNPGAAQSIMGIFGDHQHHDLHRIINLLVHDRPFQSLAQLKSIKVPCLIVANEDDPLHPFNFGEILAEHIPSSQLKKITSRYVDPGAYRTEVRTAIHTFIKEIEK